MSTPSPQSSGGKAPRTVSTAQREHMHALAQRKRSRSRTDVTRWPLKWSGSSNTKEGELYRAVVRQLTQHVGGSPNYAQAMLVSRIAWLQVHLAHLDEKAMRNGGLGDNGYKSYLAWSNSVCRSLNLLGLKGSAAPKPTLAAFLAERGYAVPGAEPPQRPPAPSAPARTPPKAPEAAGPPRGGESRPVSSASSRTGRPDGPRSTQSGRFAPTAGSK